MSVMDFSPFNPPITLSSPPSSIRNPFPNKSPSSFYISLCVHVCFVCPYVCLCGCVTCKVTLEARREGQLSSLGRS